MTDRSSNPNAFRRAWWLPGAHLQTLYPALLRRFRPPPLQRERIELPDGDFLDIDRGPRHDGPLVVLLHGLEGSIRSHYAAGLMAALNRCGFEVALMHFRGCSGEPNRLPRAYHSGETGDLDYVLGLLHARLPQRPLFGVGVSLGGNVLLKWLGEHPQQSLLRRAIAISVPFELNKAALRLESGLSRLYQAYLLGKLRRATRARAARVHLPAPVERLDQFRTLRAFDHHITAPLHGFAGADDYYRRCSSRQFLKYIETPTLILHALDDPFMTPDSVPGPEDLGPGITLELSEHGGHVGFIGGRWPGRARYWLDRRVCEYFGAAAPGAGRPA